MSLAVEMRRSTNGARAVRRILCAQIGAARTALRGHPGDARIHRARKSMKAARAALRLLRPLLPPLLFQRQNRLLRDAARELGCARDAQSSPRRYPVFWREPGWRSVPDSQLSIGNCGATPQGSGVPCSDCAGTGRWPD